MKILVTGANGYLGVGIVKAILDSGNDVVAVDFKVNHVDSRATKMECDLFEVENPFRFCGEPDILLHLAWKEGSMHEIGFFEGSINENTPCHPTTPYGIGKNALRDLTEMVCKKSNIVFQWLRGYYIVGNSKYGSSIFSKITVAAEEGKKEFPFTLGQNQYDFIDYPDFCAQVAATVSQNQEQGIINICSGRPEKLADRVERFIKENNYDIKLQYGAFQDRPYDSKAIWGDSTKIEKIMEDSNNGVNRESQ